ncbi:uncharacterized protein F5Z01DRAFT_631548 [Emericellopsis atlantica]|uniref:Uncharacterized protein n=1 Tax=Emericellopsis atlantica TaxID=2614577 RepID=A0A9P8CLE4_9HYPO|nr:uncharacterized protein F5Z01DRAFT_631548 [Emericellopsis atlantica]KAG9249526.1 hypothetical protein F5Z01DRAFT_631548 [Emericellopsis atlantica]
MDHIRGLSQFGQENPRAPPSPDLDALFNEVFDYPALLGEPVHWPQHAYSYTQQPQHQHLSKLVTEFPSRDALEARFYRMSPSFGSDNATTSPTYSGHSSPPDLIQGGSTSPSEHSDHELPEYHDRPSRHASRSPKGYRAHHDEHWAYPVHGSHKPSRRELVHHKVRGPIPGGATGPIDQGPGPKLPSGRTPAKRPRQLENPDQTADVRKSGACLPCRVSKTRCHENGVCPACRKAFPEHSHLVCARKSLSELWPIIGQGPDIWSRNPKKEAAFCAEARPRIFTGVVKPIKVFFSTKPSADSPFFHAYVQPYRWRDEDGNNPIEKVSLSSASGQLVDHSQLQQWVEAQIYHERDHAFPSAVQRFLMDYANEGRGLPQHRLVCLIHRMGCFYRIWKTSSFGCRDPSGRVSVLPISVQAQLRHIAMKAIHSIEGDILRQLDNLTTPAHQPKQDDRLALWAGLWQLMLFYRDLTASIETLAARLEADFDPAHPLYARVQYLSDGFFPLLATFYHYQFRTKKSLEVSLDWLRSSKYNGCRYKAIEHSGRILLDSRKHFLQGLQSSQNEIDQRLCVFVVNHELKKLNARKRAPKSSRSKGAEDDCDDDYE